MMCRHYLHKLRPLILLVAFSVTGGGRGVLGGNKGDEADLIIRTILTNYEPQAHPNSDRDDGAVVVDIDLSPLSISIDEEKSVMTSHVWLALAWRDKRLIWDKRQHQNISKVHVGPQRLWKPDIRLFNSVEHEDYEATDVVIYSHGQLFWVPPVTTHTTCNLDYKYWPWDVQTCSLLVGSWTKNGWEIDVSNMNKRNVSDVHMDNFVMTMWDVVKAQSIREVKQYENLTTPWPAIRVDLTVRRVSWMDRKLAVLPLILVSCLTLATFWTHPSSGNRIRLGGLNFLVVIFVLLELRNRFPLAGAQLPLVVSFAGSLGVLVTIQLLMALSVANLVARHDSPPSFLIWPLQGSLGNFLCLSDLPLVGQIPGMNGFSIDVEAMRAQQQSGASGSSEANKDSAAPQVLPSVSKPSFSGWNLLCQAIDRLLFIAFFAIIFIFIASYLGGAAVASTASAE